MCHLSSRLRFILFPTILFVLQLYINTRKTLVSSWMLSQPQRSINNLLILSSWGRALLIRGKRDPLWHIILLIWEKIGFHSDKSGLEKVRFTGCSVISI